MQTPTAKRISDLINSSVYQAALQQEDSAPELGKSQAAEYLTILGDILYQDSPKMLELITLIETTSSENLPTKAADYLKGYWDGRFEFAKKLRALLE